MLVEEKIKQLKKEARDLNKKSKDKVASSGQQWLEMSDEDMEDFKRWCEIKIEIEELKKGL